MAEALPTITAVVPAHDARTHLGHCLPALIEAGRGLLEEVIVVDDGSTDGTGEAAADLGARVLRSAERPVGPAAARNLGAAAAGGEVLLFVDADVVVHADAVERVARTFTEDGPAALYGSYDDSPAARNLASRYMNLRHHHVHRIPSADAATFWAGLGAVRRSAFDQVGGFDGTRFAEPSVEDIDLGRRLRAAGGLIRRDPTLLGCHRKVWTWSSVVRTDVFQRALPWARMMREHPGAFGDLNVGATERARALLALAWAASIPLAISGATDVPVFLPLGAAAFLANLPLAGTLLRGGGPRLAVVGILFHQVYYLYSCAAWFVARFAGGSAGGGAAERRPPTS
ncbi:MAG: glycosyltransferase [Planctomycetota bacterium]|jgi:glycosyltransferase involved in cell wall biosynthesis|nr:glycosyltransferase [Planctomycetota bacterium]MDP6764264.1 glycosyltransferase [Planctomycetota bacterium]MDP6990422.1 glycosyltransferase [Planctomycetota bacterium]